MIQAVDIQPKESSRSHPDSKQIGVMETVERYHDLSKHSFYRYAPGPETLDWDNQPDPFRSFEGTSSINLLLDAYPQSHGFYSMLASLPSSPEPINLRSISALMRHALGLSAWKQYGPDRWSLRVNPSSGNLHPTEAYLIIGAGVECIPAGLYHYNVKHHQLEKRADIDSGSVPSQTLAVALTSVPWRELWKYGERGFRYTQLDTGHAISALAFSARDLGWQISIVKDVHGAKLARMLGLDRAEYSSVEEEIAECLLWIGPSLHSQSQPSELPLMKNWVGLPSKLGERGLYQWPWADLVAKAITNSETSQKLEIISVLPEKLSVPEAFSKSRENEAESILFGELALKRRSAQAFDGSSIDYQQFILLLNSLLRCSQPLYSNQPAIDFIVMVHRVDGLSPGLYVMPAHDEQRPRLEDACNKWQDWKKVTEVGDSALYQLKVANVQKAVATLCCQQAIAADSAFTIGFFADFSNSLKHFGVQTYRHLYWQAGMLSQQLYLQATALNLAATGIGCFYDDPWQGFLGENTASMQMLYLTAVGNPVMDERISSFSGYYYLAQETEDKIEIADI